MHKCTNVSNASNADYVNFPEILKRRRSQLTSSPARQLTSSLNSTQDFLVIPLSGIPSGNYICSLRVGGKPLQNVRFVVIK